MRHFDPDQMKIARTTDLHAYLLRYHADRFKIEGVSIHPKDNMSLSIKRGYSGYLDFATGDKGNSVDFLVNYMGYELDQAVFALCGETAPVFSKQNKEFSKTEKSQPIFPTPTDGAYKQLYAYLTNRGISAETIKMLIDQKILYQDIHNNVIFANKERNWGERRGTNTYADTRCVYRNECLGYEKGDHGWCIFMDQCEKYKKDKYRGMIANSRADGFWWFQIGKNKAEKVYICESSIDAISLYELQLLNQIDENGVYVSIGGAAKQPAIDRLKQRCRVILAVDNDPSGSQCRLRNPNLESIIPTQKDWNDDLVLLREDNKRKADAIKDATLPDGSIDPFGPDHAKWMIEMIEKYAKN